MISHLRLLRLFLLTLGLALGAAIVPSSQLQAQTVIDMHTGKVSGKTRDDYNYKAREAWQMREDSIEYENCIIRAFNYLYTDSLQAAQNLLERALKLRPDAPGNAVVRQNIGRIFMTRHQWKDAANIYSRVLEEFPRNVEVREERASCFMELGQFDRALKDYDFLLVVRPDDQRYRLLHAIVMGKTGQKRDAVDELDELIDAHADYAEAYLVRAGLYTELGIRGYARRDLDRAVSLGVKKEEIIGLYEKLK